MSPGDTVNERCRRNRRKTRTAALDSSGLGLESSHQQLTSTDEGGGQGGVQEGRRAEKEALCRDGSGVLGTRDRRRRTVTSLQGGTRRVKRASGLKMSR